MENKIAKLADIIVNYSLKVEKDERVLIMMETMNPKNLVKHLIEKIYANGGVPTVKIVDEELNSLIYENLNEAEDMIKNKSNGSIFAIVNFDYVNPFNELMKEE